MSRHITVWLSGAAEPRPVEGRRPGTNLNDLLTDAIHITSMSDFYNHDYQFIILNLIKDPINALSDTIFFLTGKLFYARRPRLRSQGFNAL